VTEVSVSGSAGTGYGAGGGAGADAANTARAGGAGAPGLCIITEYGITTLGSAATTAGAVRFDVAQGLTTNQQAQARSNIGTTKRNYLINGAFQINQGGYASGAVLAAAAYGHDQWKAGASGGDYSFTQSTGATTITIAAGKSLIQPIEDIRVTGGGSYVLAWTGTAQARAGVNTLTPSGTYAASPLLISGQTDGTVMSVEFNAGTLGSVGLYEGNVAPPFAVPDYPGELIACKRYWQRIGGTSTEIYMAGYSLAGNGIVQTLPYPVAMRATPTITVVGTWTITNCTGITLPGAGTRAFALQITAGATGFVSAFTPNDTTYVSLNARL